MKKELFLTWTERQDSAANVAESWNLAIKQNGSVDKKLTEQDIQGLWERPWM